MKHQEAPRTTVPGPPSKSRLLRRAEPIFERLLWASRFMVILPVLACTLVSLALFIIGTLDVAAVVGEIWRYYAAGDHRIDIHVDAIGNTIGAVDTYLIAVVLLIFAFGLYELFISRIDPAERSEASNILEIKNLDSLKERLAQVIIMALIVRFFQLVLTIHLATTVEMAVLAGSVLALSLALYFLHKTRTRRGVD